MSIFLISVLDPFVQIEKSRDAKRKQELAQLQRTLEAYYNDNNSYPPGSGAVNPTYRLNPSPLLLEWGDSWPAYNTKIPKDPDSSRLYLYTVTSDGQTYRIYASLERGANDSQVCKADGSACTNVPVSTYCGTGSQVCNYGISSPNSSP